MGDDIGEVLRQVQRGDFTRPRQFDPTLDPALEAVCLKAMALNPDERYGSCRALAEDVERWMADEPIGAYREPLVRRARWWMRRHRGATQAGAFGVVAVALVATLAAVLVNGAARAEQALTGERLAKAEAQSNFARARRTVDDYLTAVSTSVQLRRDLPGLQAFRAESPAQGSGLLPRLPRSPRG